MHLSHHCRRKNPALTVFRKYDKIFSVIRPVCYCGSAGRAAHPALPAKWRKEKARKYKRISVLFSAGSGGRTIKIDVLSSKTRHKLTKERRNNAALLAYAQFVFLTFRKRLLPKVLPESPLSLPECSGGRSRQIFTLAVQLVAVNPCGIHVLAVTNQHFQLAVGQHA